MWRLIICPRTGCLQSSIFFVSGSSSFSPLGPSRGGPAGILSFHSMPALLCLEIPTTSQGLGVECLQPSLDISGKLHVSSSCISLSSSIQVSDRTCQRSTQMFDSDGTMLDGGSLAPHNSQHVSRCLSVVSHHKRSDHGCFCRTGTQRSAISAFNPLAAQWCVLCRQGFSSSVCQAVVRATWASTSKVYQQCWKEWAGWRAQQGLPNNTVSASKLENFLVHLFWVGLAWHTIGIYHSAISTFLEPHHLHKASNHPDISKLMHHFYLQCPPSCKCFDPWDVEHLLSLLKSWAPSTSLTTFTLAWKTVTLDCYSFSTCYHEALLRFNLYIENQHLSLQHHVAIFIPMSGGKTDHLGHLPHQICIESHPLLIFSLFFYSKAYLIFSEPFRTKPDRLCVTSFFMVTIGSTGLSVLKPFLLG